MEATKAQNIIEHEDQIKSRPKKTWFQTNKERQNIKRKKKLFFNFPSKLQKELSKKEAMQENTDSTKKEEGKKKQEKKKKEKVITFELNSN